MSVLKMIGTASLLIGALSGCASLQDVNTPLDFKTGVYVPPNTLASFTNGKTKQSDVVAAVGNPTQRSEFKGNEVWTYTYTQISAIPFVGSNKFENTVFEFNSSGLLVKSYKSGGTPGQTGNPLLNAAGM